MVEAVGIEPTSESLQEQNLHACPVSFSLPAGDRSRQITRPESPRKILWQSRWRNPKLPSSPRSHALHQPVGRLSKTAALITQREVTDCWQLSFCHGLTRSWHPRHASAASTAPVEAGRPQSAIRITQKWRAIARLPAMAPNERGFMAAADRAQRYTDIRA